MPRTRKLTVELLEDRQMPSLFGMPWSEPDRLSVSFAPDGTIIDSESSALFQTMNATMSTNDWKREILRAFQTWAVQANINIGLVADGGQAIGTLGALQADNRFGDFRIAARAVTGHIGINSPFNQLSGSRAGDVAFNKNFVFGIQDPNKYDLFTAALNEVGNTLGLQDSNVTASALYGNYNGTKSGLTAADATALQALYGVRLADAYEGTFGNGTFATATVVSPGMYSGDVTTLSDADFYQFTVPEGSSVVSVRVQTGGISLLAATLTVYDSNQNVVGTVSTTDPLTGSVVLDSLNLTAGQTYYVKVESGTQTVFGIGAYRLRVHLGASSAMPSERLNNDVDLGELLDDAHTDDTWVTATTLTQPVTQTDSRFDYRLRGKVGDTTDVDFYRLTSPTAPTGKTNTLVATVRALDSGDAAIYPKITVHDANGLVVASEVLVNNEGAYTVQVKNAANNATYYVQVAPASVSVHSTGSYALSVDLRTDSTTLTLAASGTLSDSTKQAWSSLRNLEGQMFHFVLPASTGAVHTAITMTIYNSANQVVGRKTSINGAAGTLDVYLASGDYTVRFEAGAINNQALPTITFELRCERVTDPIDPPPVDGDTPPPADTYSFDTNGTAEYNFLTTNNAYDNPWNYIFNF